RGGSVSYTRDRSTSETDHGTGGARQPFAPGKANLTDGLIQRKASGPGKRTLTGAPVPRGTDGDDGAARSFVPVGRDLQAAEIGEAPAPQDPRITTPAPGGGANVAATVVGATAETELARDGGLTPALIAALHANPDLSVDEVLQHIAAFPI